MWWSVGNDIDTIELLPIKNDATRVAALLSGDIDFTNFTPAQDINRINGSALHKVESTPQARTIFFGMDQGVDELIQRFIILDGEFEFIHIPWHSSRLWLMNSYLSAPTRPFARTEWWR